MKYIIEFDTDKDGESERFTHASRAQRYLRELADIMRLINDANVIRKIGAFNVDELTLDQALDWMARYIKDIISQETKNDIGVKQRLESRGIFL